MSTRDALLKTWNDQTGPGHPWLLMCPFAGASASAFAGWRQRGDLGLNVLLATYRGRDQRMKETPCTTIGAIADELASGVATLPPERQESLLLAGHSMGAQVAFETARRLQRRDCAIAGLVLSGCHAPHLDGRRHLTGLSDEAFMEELTDIGGCSPALLEDRQLLHAFLPLLRADFQATESYSIPWRDDAERLCMPTLLVYGHADAEAGRDEVAAWRQWIAGEVEIRAINGDHFYPVTRPRAFCTAIQAFARRT